MKNIQNTINEEDENAAGHLAIKEEDHNNKCIQMQMIVAGLHDKIRSKVLESGKTTPHKIYKKALEMEGIKEDKEAKAAAPAQWAI